MTDVLGLLAWLVLPLAGILVWRLEAVRTLDLGGRLAAAFAAGALLTAVVMALLSALGIGWTRTRLYLVLGVIAMAGMMLVRGQPRGDRPRRSRVAGAVILGFAVLTGYGLLTARQTSGDLHFIWGPKAVRFFRAAGIDFEYLGHPLLANQVPDYPPLLPLLYAWSNSVAHQFPWWAALLAAGLFLFASVLFVRASSGDDHGAVLMAATLAYTFATSYASGGGDPPLLFFEIVAMSALTFLDGRRGADVLAAIALAGAAWTKVEGTTFVIAVVLSLIVVRRAFKRAVLVAIPAAVLVGGWIAALASHQLVTQYSQGRGQLHWNTLPTTLVTMAANAGYGLYGLPWIIPLVLIAFGDVRRALFPLSIAVLTTGVVVFFYLHEPDPGFWIASSASRVLQTPLAALLIAAIAARPAGATGRAGYARVPAHGLVPQGEETEGSGGPEGLHSGGVVGQV